MNGLAESEGDQPGQSSSERCQPPRPPKLLFTCFARPDQFGCATRALCRIRANSRDASLMETLRSRQASCWMLPRYLIPARRYLILESMRSKRTVARGIGMASIRFRQVTNMTTPIRPAWASDRREVIEHRLTPRSRSWSRELSSARSSVRTTPHRNLFTGLLTLAPKAVYPVYTRPFVEALVLITGDVAMDVENRRYRPGLVDAMIIPAGLSRRVVNLSASRAAVIHVALPSPTVEQTWVNARFTPVDEPVGSTGHPGAERLCRNRPANRFELAPKALFQDLYNAELGTKGICGGHGVFEPGARLPCHRHEFDESITIVQGTATCVVEGQRYELSDRRPHSCPRDAVTTSSTSLSSRWPCSGSTPAIGPTASSWMRLTVIPRKPLEPVVHCRAVSPRIWWGCHPLLDPEACRSG